MSQELTVVSVPQGAPGIEMPDGLVYTAGQTVFLTDDQYSQLDPALVSGGYVSYVGDTESTANAIKQYATSIGDGSSLSYTVTHQLGTTDVSVTVIDLTDNDIVYPTVALNGTDAVVVSFGSPPAAAEMRVIVRGI